MSGSSKPTPIALPNELTAKVERVAQLTGYTKAQTMRIAMEIGLKDLELIDGDIAGAIHEKAKALRASMAAGALTVAEPPGNYKAKKRTA